MRAAPHANYFCQVIFDLNRASFVMETTAFFIARSRVVINPIITVIQFNSNVRPTNVTRESSDHQQ